MSSTTITRGNSHETFYIGVNITPASVTNGTTSNQTFSCPGLLTTDILVSQGYIANQTSGIFIVETDCLTAGVLTLQFGKVKFSLLSFLNSISLLPSNLLVT